MITIAWDVDDVLNSLMYEWFNNKWLPGHPECNLRFDDITENPPDKLLGVTRQQYLGSLDDFRLSGEFYKMKPVIEMEKWFLRYGDDFRHIAVTSVPIKAAGLSAQWVISNFGRWIRTFHFIPSSRQTEQIPEYDRNKGGFLRWLGKVDFFVDDNEDNIGQCKGCGVKTVLFPRPWNKSRSTITEALTLLAGG